MALADEPKELLARLLPEQPGLAGTLELVWRQACKAFPGPALEQWLARCRSLANGPLGGAATLVYVRSAPACAGYAGPTVALVLADTAAHIAETASVRAAAVLCAVAPKAMRRLGSAAAFSQWLQVIERLAPLAPESLAALLDRSEAILAELDVRGFEAWALGGVRAAAGDPDKRLKFLSLTDVAARRRLAQATDAITFSTVERPLKAYFTALWGRQPLIRAGAAPGGEPRRRTSFGDGIIRLPDSFPGFVGDHAVALFRAAVAHVGAHFRFSPARFPVGSLKPVQIALVSLIEDARVEHLALREFPGLARLWLPFHVAEAAGAATAPGLMARLARALLDAGFDDGDVWVAKGRQMFFDQRENWHDPAISRHIGGLLGNDLGQMRVQFNARTYTVEPAYRDDNLGLWDFGDSGEAGAEAEQLFEAVHFDQRDDATIPPDRERETVEDTADDAPNRAALAPAAADDIGIPVARYPEWDYLIGRDRADWATILEFSGQPGQPGTIERILERHARLANRITTLIRSAKVSRPVRLRRQPEGDTFDLDACIAAAASRRQGQTPDPRVYTTLQRRHRDLSVLVLLDISESTNDRVPVAGASVLALEREATSLLAHAMDGLGDPFALRAFCSNGRDEVRYYRVKDFEEPFDGAAKLRLAGLTGGLSTRIGSAMRHAGAELARRNSYRRLLLVVTDGEPSDVDVGDRRYLVEDARKAVMSLSHRGIDVFCAGLDAGGDSYLTRIFGRHNVLQIDRLDRLPEKLPMLYLRLTA